MSFNVRQLRCAVAAADHGSFYRAARVLDVEPSTLSRTILKLEHALGMPVFVRSRAGVTLTPAGEAFIASAKCLVAIADKVVARMRAASKGRAGDLVLGHNSSISAGNLRATMISWHKAYPDVDVRYVEASRDALLVGLDTGAIDVAILTGAQSSHELRCEPFWSERILAALPSAHPLARADIVHWTELRSERFLLSATDAGLELRDMLMGRLPVASTTPDIRMLEASRDTVLSVLAACSGISLVCEGATGARYPDVVYRPIHGEQGPALTLHSGYWRAGNDKPTLRRFLELVKARFALPYDFAGASPLSE